MQVSLLSVLVLMLLPVLGSGAAQEWEEQVADQIATIHEQIAPDYEYASDMLIGELEPGESDGFELELEGDAEYVIVGVCDTECGDLDLAIYDPEEEEAAADIEQDDYPVLEVEGEGSFWVEVMMADCEGDSCLYAIQVFVRQ